MKVERLVVASKNSDKVTEVEHLLSVFAPSIEVVRGLEWDDVDETEETLEGNALLKARAVATATGCATLADDTGLEVDALEGAPGVRTARYAGEAATYESNVAKLLSELEGVTDRSARFRTVVAIVTSGGEEATFEGVLEGVIASERRGEHGFGYDPIFEVDGRTLAEISLEDKNDISHRGRALRAAAVHLTRD